MELHNEFAADKPMLLPQPSDRSKGVQEEPQKPRLTMKVLYELIQELQQENRSLAYRLEVLECRLAEEHTSREKVAATAEMPVSGECSEFCDLVVVGGHASGFLRTKSHMGQGITRLIYGASDRMHT